MVYTVTVVTVAGSSVTGDHTQELVLKPDRATSFDLSAVAQGPADTCVPRVMRAAAR